jgi:hypothetical protein
VLSVLARPTKVSTDGSHNLEGSLFCGVQSPISTVVVCFFYIQFSHPLVFLTGAGHVNFLM